MRRERLNDAGGPGTSFDQGEASAIARHADEGCVVARRGGRTVRRSEFVRAVAALAARLPDRDYVINLCADRYRFMVGLAAALSRRQITLLPPANAPGVLRAVAEDYADAYALAEADCPALPSLIYADDLDDSAGDDDAGPTEVPAVPAEQPALILFTSGSTGRPKPVPKSWGTLVQSARSAGERLGVARLSGATVIGTVPHQHSYGLESMILLGLQHGLAVDAGGLFFPADIRAAIEAAPGPRILVTTPIHLRALVAEPEDMPPVDLILSATAPLPVALAARAEACFNATLIEIYGCTEAGQIATRRTVQDEDWHCLDGVALHGTQGATWASGPAVEGVALLHDVISPIGAATFRLGGRSADLVDVAGKRTSLAHLNHQLLGIDGVTDGVFFMPGPDGRPVARLAALAVAPGLTQEAILQALRERIDIAFLPRPLVLVEALPRDALGKLPRAALLELIGRRQGV
jgi:acyl-coenzyme A synthetase/AMP-(fatty) acid ligase